MKILQKLTKLLTDTCISLILPFLNEKHKFSLIYKTGYWTSNPRNDSKSGGGLRWKLRITSDVNFQNFWKNITFTRCSIYLVAIFSGYPKLTYPCRNILVLTLWKKWFLSTLGLMALQIENLYSLICLKIHCPGVIL